MATVIGCVLAGGRSSRMGTDKAFVELRGKPLIEHVVERARPQVDKLLINGNDAVALAPYRCTVVPDSVAGFAGPLAGLSASLDWIVTNRPAANWLATFACDTPFFPLDLVKRLVAEAEAVDAPIAVAACGAQHHPVFAVWRSDLRDDAKKALGEGVRKMDDFIARHGSVRVPFDTTGIDPFFNINTPDDLTRAEIVHD